MIQFSKIPHIALHTQSASPKTSEPATFNIKSQPILFGGKSEVIKDVARGLRGVVKDSFSGYSE